MKKPRIRPLAICVFRRGDRILVSENYDPTREETFYRPLGGGIEFGERSIEAARREIREELGAEVRNLRLLGVLENIFTFGGRPGHEVVFVFDAAFEDPSFYERRELTGYEGEDEPFTVVWKRLSDFGPGGPPLYPEDLLDLLRTDEQDAVAV